MTSSDVIILDCPECEDRFFEAIHLEEHVSHKHRPLPRPLPKQEPENTPDNIENTRDVTEKVVLVEKLINDDRQIESKQQQTAKIAMPIISTRKAVLRCSTTDLPQSNKLPVLIKPCSVVLRRISLGKGAASGVKKVAKDAITKPVDFIIPKSPIIRKVPQIISKANLPNVITLTPAKVNKEDISFLTPPMSMSRKRNQSMSGMKKSTVKLVPLEKLVTADNKITNEPNINFKDTFTPMKSVHLESKVSRSIPDNQVMTKVHPDFRALINSLTLKTEEEEFSVKCGSCSEGFIDTKHLMIHMERAHSNPSRSHHRSFSDLQTPQRKSLPKQNGNGAKSELNANNNKMGNARQENSKSDQSLSRQKNYLCLDCDQTFYTQAYLERHTKLKHT
jgi:hypothetical protein